MYRIGDFSRITNVTVKTLRYYAREGLLTPIWVDRFTSYRYYSLEQLPRLNRILALKDLGFSLEEIKPLLNTTLPVEELRGILTRKKTELELRLRSEQHRLVRVEQRLDQIEHESELSNSDVVLRRLKACTCALADTFAATWEQVPAARLALSKLITGYCEQLHIRIRGPWFSMLESPEYDERDIQINLGVCVDSGAVIPNSAGSEPVRFERTLAVGQAACLLGNLDSLPPLPALMHWIDLNRYQINGSTRMVYLGDPAESGFTKGAVEVQVPVTLRSEELKIIKEMEMEPVKYETLPAFKVMGMKYRGKNENQEIAVMWGNLNKRLQEIPMEGKCAFGVCLMLPGENEGVFEYVAGFKVSSGAKPPEGMVVIDVPENRYAVFEHRGSLQILGNTYKKIAEWWKSSGQQPVGEYDMEVYDEKFKDFSPDSVFYIYEPVK